MTFSLTVDSPIEDLKIKQGSFIRKGQVIADLGKKRLILENQKRKLEADLKAVESTGTVNFSTQAEQESIAFAEQQLKAAQTALQDYEKTSPWTDFARSNLPLAEEEVELTQLSNNLQQGPEKFSGCPIKARPKAICYWQLSE